MEFLAGLTFGVAMALLSVAALAKTRPELLSRLGFRGANPTPKSDSPAVSSSTAAPTQSAALATIPVFQDPAGEPAMNPADPDLPDAVDATDVAKIDRIPHLELRKLLQTLRTWTPKHHRSERLFQMKFGEHLFESGYPESAIARHHRVRWTAEDRAPDSEDDNAIPDFSVGSVLVEIKRNFTASNESDRALGQMARYCIAWRRRGPVLLVVCNEFDHNLRLFVIRTVKGWKAQGVPAMAYFVRAQSRFEEGDDEFAVGAINNGTT